MACVEITPGDFDDMHHALGRPDLATLREGENYRNYFATEAGSPWAVHAETLGVWDRITRDGAGIVTYRLNGDGKSALADWLSLQRGAEPSAAFTPGPLVFGDSSMDDPSPGPKWEVYTPRKAATAYCWKRADAQLYTAAPDLLVALRNTLAIARIKWGNLDPQANEVMRRAEVAIAKALGQAAADTSERTDRTREDHP